MIGKCYLPGPTLALDGLVIETRKPTEEVMGMSWEILIEKGIMEWLLSLQLMSMDISCIQNWNTLVQQMMTRPFSILNYIRVC
jgi:hypothetical protein